MTKKRSRVANLHDTNMKNNARYNEDPNPIATRIAAKKKRVQLVPLNVSQEKYLHELNNKRKDIVFAVGPAGTGKTKIAVQWAVDQLKNGDIDKLVITRPAVSVDEEHGFLPGDINEKMKPWTLPMQDVFLENWDQAEIDHMIKEGIIELSPMAYMRGRSFKDSIIVADEMQCCTESQMKMLLTRVGEGCKMIITGDLDQADRGAKNGLKFFLDLYESIKDKPFNSRISMASFGKDDIVRSAVVAEVLSYYDTIKPVVSK